MNNEFAQLLDLALTQGIKHSEIISAINEAVAEAFKKNHPGEKRAFSVVVDEKSGTVRMISGNTDITPSEFSPLAEIITRQTLILLLKNVKTPSENTGGKGLGELVLSWIIAILFWGYNSLYIVLFFFFLIGLSNMEFRNSIVESVSSLGIVHQILVLILITSPLITTFYALREQMSKRTVNLVRLFFMLEVPLVFLILIILTITHDAIMPIQFFSLLSIFIPIVVYLHYSGYNPSRFGNKVTLLSVIIPVLLGLLYFTTLFSFFLPVIIGTVAKSIFGGIIYELGIAVSRGFSQYFSVYSIISFILAFPFVLLFLTIFVFLLILPYQLVYIFAKLFINLRLQLIASWTKISTDLFCLIYSILLILFFIFISYQPDISPTIVSLSKITGLTTFEEKEAVAEKLMAEENSLRRLLLDMYDARSRYPFIRDDNLLYDQYRNVFNIGDSLSEIIPSLFCRIIQSAFNLIAYPFTYQGTIKGSNEAAVNYQYLFGHSIYENTKKITETKEVVLLNRKVSVNQDYAGLFADVTIEEEYANNSTRNQEIIYEFSLPSDAVITGLKLGADLEFEGIVSPKGAAQTVYQQEVNRSRDPALLEQTGPRQYRLRVFPIPGKNDLTTLKGKNQKVQFTYVAGVAPEGFPLPVYSTITNLDTTTRAKLTFLLNNESVTSERRNASYLKNPATGGAPIDLCGFRNNLTPKTAYPNLNVFIVPHLQNVYLAQNSICNKKTGIWFPKLLRNYKIAVLLDVSYENRQSELPEALRSLLSSNKGLVDHNSIDLYLFNDKISIGKAITSDILSKPFNLVYFGSSDLYKTISSIKDPYDLMIIATGKNIPNYFSGVLPERRFPIYLLHNNGEIPPYGNKLTEFIIKSHGKVTDTFQEALNHFALSRQLPTLDNSLLYIDIAPFWSIGIKLNNDVPVSEVIPSDIREKDLVFGMNFITFDSFAFRVDDPLTFIVGNKYLMDDLSRQTMIYNMPISYLDNFHNFAKRGNFITPYSSLIALVSDQQKSNLNNQEQLANRYEENSFNNRPIINPIIGGIPQSGGGVDISISRPDIARISSGGILNSFMGTGISNLSIGSPKMLSGGSDSNFSFSSLLTIFIPVNLLIIFVSLVAFFVSFIGKSLSKFRKKKTQ